MYTVINNIINNLDKIKRQKLRELRTTQFLPEEEINILQRKKLEDILYYAFQNVDYYRDTLKICFKKGQFDFDSFHLVPFLDKVMIKKLFKDLISREKNKLNTFTNMTGGSIGEPGIFLQERSENKILGSAVLLFFYEWHGIKPEDKEIKLWGSQRDITNLNGIKEKLKNIISRTKILNAFDMSPDNMEKFVSIINKYKPRFIRGYSNALFELARFAEQNHIKLFSPKLVISSAGTLYNHFRYTIEKAFKCKVFNHYGSRELHNIAMECPFGSMHISSMTHYVEIIDDKDNIIPRCSDKEGEIVITSLINRAMPLIRYKTGDKGSWGNYRCSCGRGLPILGKITGRVVESFKLGNGTIIPGEYFIHLLGVQLNKNIIKKFQVIQEAKNKILIKVIFMDNISNKSDFFNEVEKEIHCKYGNFLEIKFAVVENIPAEPSGKYLYTKSFC